MTKMNKRMIVFKHVQTDASGNRYILDGKGRSHKLVNNTPYFALSQYGESVGISHIDNEEFFMNLHDITFVNNG